MNRKIDPVSGWASAHRYNLASSTTILKTRFEPCRIAVRADPEKCDALTENRQWFRRLSMSFVVGQSEVTTMNCDLVRFLAHCRRKTEHSQRRCELLFPYGTGRSQSNGLLEQMP